MFYTRLTQIELAARWRISHRTLEYWRSLGEGPRFIKIGRLVIYPMEDVVAFENRELSEIPADKAGG
ncbi:DNA-binding protein [Paracoccus sp. (in: a-proteobacteria)]|uniref:helix-turn-helix transcriptional regulator n=1 Tax=Paracoccus sp. TaxID=267 RepID=UPI002899CBEB|nr:DNA-binding protein [Paracoccus sp. (in: a-proteobacteria)]